MDITNALLSVASLIYFFLPAYAANIAPVLCKKIFKSTATPIDRGKTLFGKPLFGAHKTWRGIIAAILAGTVVFVIQAWLAWQGIAYALALFDYTTMPLYLGTFMGIGAMFGDLCKSFVKRRIGIKAGHPWYVIDQVDYVAGAILLTSLFFFPGWRNVAILTVVSFALAVIANHIAYRLKIRSVKW